MQLQTAGPQALHGGQVSRKSLTEKINALHTSSARKTKSKYGLSQVPRCLRPAVSAHNADAGSDKIPGDRAERREEPGRSRLAGCDRRGDRLSPQAREAASEQVSRPDSNVKSDFTVL